jgi:threonine/homoserine/homoserine lactone efflux protein
MGSRDSGSRLPVHVTLPVIFGVALATGFSGAVVPGSVLAVVVRETLRVGWSAGPIMMIGHAALELIAIVLLVTGLMRFAASARVRGIIGLVGALVLLYLGYQTFQIPVGAAMIAVTPEHQTTQMMGDSGWLRLMWLGALMSMANPYWWLWWATIGVAHSSWATRRGRLGGGTYYVGHVMSDVIWYSAVSIALGAGRSLLSGEVMRAIYMGCGLFLLGLGVMFGVAGVKGLWGAWGKTVKIEP